MANTGGYSAAEYGAKVSSWFSRANPINEEWTAAPPGAYEPKRSPRFMSLARPQSGLDKGAQKEHVKQSRGIIIAVVIGLAALVSPLWLSILLAWRQSVADEMTRVRGYAVDGVTRTDRVSTQLLEAMDRLQGADLKPCSPEELALMRQIDLQSRYVQAVGRLSGDTLICDSQGSPPIHVGPVGSYTEDGSGVRLHFQFPFAKQQAMPSSLRLISRGSFAVLVDTRIALDTPVDSGGVVDLFRPSAPHPFSAAAEPDRLQPAWYRNIEKGSATAFIDSGYVVALARSRTYDDGIIAASPLVHAQERVARFALIFVPIGLACGVALAWTVYSISRRSLALSSILRAAVRRREFEVEYQPIVDLESSRWVGAEAVLRWRHDGQDIRPDLFLPAAEERGVITEITGCVMEIVATNLPELLAIDRSFYIAINLSASDLRSTGLEERLRELMREGRASARNLKVEATERGLLQGESALAVLKGIRAMGVRVAIDDFGTGYSSLAALQNLELDALKIDKSFVDTIGTDGATSEVVSHIIRLAQSLKLELVAEGVESAAQAKFLSERGVKWAQGWHYAKPMRIEALRAALSAQRLENEVA